MFDATISKDIKKFSEKQIYIISRKGQKDLLMESDTEKETREWTDAITAHINYANATFTGDAPPSIRTSTGRTTSTRCKIQMMFSYHISSIYTLYFVIIVDRAGSSTLEDGYSMSSPSLSRKDSTGPGGRDSEEGESPSTSTFTITPKPAWVVKVLRNNGEKIFVNLCEHQDIPMMQLALNLGFNKWPFMILTPARTIREEKEDESMEISIYDAIVNPAVVSICNKDPQAKDAVMFLFLCCSFPSSNYEIVCLSPFLFSS